jgi:hypothetical protein
MMTTAWTADGADDGDVDDDRAGDGEHVGLDDLEDTDDLRVVLPRYRSAALCDVLPSVACALGVPGLPDVLRLEPARRVCVFLVDGLGAHLLREHADVAPLLAEALADSGRVLSAGFPSTTAVSLASLGTGLPPGAHGMLGYRLRVPASGELMNMLRWDADVDPLIWQPHETVLQRAERDGVSVSHVSALRFAQSGLTRSGLRGGTFVGADSDDERIRQALDALSRGDRSLVYLYYGDLDFAGHLGGVDSDGWREQLAHVEQLVDTLTRRLPADARLYVTADHGMIDVPHTHRLDVDQDPELRAGVALLGGEGRARHLYAHPGAAPDVLAIWRERLGRHALVRSREAAIAEGWFGPAVDSAMAARIGDVVVALRGDYAVVATRREALESQLVGMHGSLTEREQHVPLLEFGD